MTSQMQPSLLLTQWWARRQSSSCAALLKHAQRRGLKQTVSQVDSADQLTHDMALDAENLKAEPGLDVFKADPEYAAHEKEYEVCARVASCARAAVVEQTFGYLWAGMHPCHSSWQPTFCS